MSKDKKPDDKTLSDAIAKAFASQVQRTMGVMRVKGWKFPPGADVGVTVLASKPLTTKVSVRMDDVSLEVNISTANAKSDVVEAVDNLVAQWLKKHATEKPSRKGHAHV